MFHQNNKKKLFLEWRIWSLVHAEVLYVSQIRKLPKQLPFSLESSGSCVLIILRLYFGSIV